jgi:hypothetical protein
MVTTVRWIGLWHFRGRRLGPGESRLRAPARGRERAANFSSRAPNREFSFEIPRHGIFFGLNAARTEAIALPKKFLERFGGLAVRVATKMPVMKKL